MAKRVRSPHRQRLHAVPSGKAVWRPELIGVVIGYPKTQEAWEHRNQCSRERMIAQNAAGKTRKGVPDGWAGRREEVKQITAVARKEAERIIRVMIDTGELNDEAMGNEALRLAMEVASARDPETDQYVYTARDRLQAMKLIADFTKTRPVVKTETDLKGAEAWLAALAAEPVKPARRTKK